MMLIQLFLDFKHNRLRNNYSHMVFFYEVTKTELLVMEALIFLLIFSVLSKMMLPSFRFIILCMNYILMNV